MLGTRRYLDFNIVNVSYSCRTLIKELRALTVTPDIRKEIWVPEKCNDPGIGISCCRKHWSIYKKKPGRKITTGRFLLSSDDLGKVHFFIIPAQTSAPVIDGGRERIPIFLHYIKFRYPVMEKIVLVSWLPKAILSDPRYCP